MQEQCVRAVKFLLVVLLLTGLYFLFRSDLQKTVQNNNSSVSSFALAMQSWNELREISQNFRSAKPTPLVQAQIRSLLEKTISRLQACDRNELEKAYPGWGAQRDLFLSAAYGYLQGLEKEELWSRDLIESQLKIDNFYSWMNSNRTDLQKFLPIALTGEAKTRL